MNRKCEEYDLTLYSARSIRAAIGYYQSICKIDLQMNEKTAKCSFDIDARYADQVIKEFGNFLIELLQHEDGNVNVNY